MSVSFKKIVLWQVHVEDKPGTLSGVLAPLAEAGADLQVVMGYHLHAQPGAARIEVAPVTGKKATTAARKAGFSAAMIPTLLVRGDNRPGLGHAIAQAIAAAGINVTFLVAQVIGGQFSAVIALPDEAAAKLATSLIKKAAKSTERRPADSD